MESVVQYMCSQTNHTLMNSINLYNFVISVFEDLYEDQRQSFINKLKMQVGLSFCDGLKTYIFRKNSKHEILDFL